MYQGMIDAATGKDVSSKKGSSRNLKGSAATKTVHAVAKSFDEVLKKIRHSSLQVRKLETSSKLESTQLPKGLQNLQSNPPRRLAQLLRITQKQISRKLLNLPEHLLVIALL